MHPIRSASGILAAGGVAVLLAACGSGATTGTTAAAGHSTPPKPSAASATAGIPAPHAARALGPRIGTTRTVSARGTKLSITVTKVIDPLHGSGATLLPATRVVGVFVRIANRGPGGYDSSSTGDISIVASAGATSPAYAPSGACQTQDRDFDNAIGSGETREGCLVFTLDARAKLVGERFSADGGGAGVVTWRGPKQ